MTTSPSSAPDVSQPPARLRLRSIALTGARAAVRRTGFVVVAAAAMIAGIGYMLPAHRQVYVPRSGSLDLLAQPGEAAFHSNFADAGPLSLIVLAAVAVATLVLRGRRWLGAGMVAGALGMGGAVVAVMQVLLVHLFSRHESGIGEHVFSIGVIGLFCAGAAVVVAEPILFVLERRRLEQAARPAPLPVASVASRR